MKGLAKKGLTLLIVSFVAVLTVTVLVFRSGASPGTEFITKAAEIGPIRRVVNATGTVQPVVAVQVGTQVSGQILEIYADFNSIVKRGQLLARIDPRNSEAQVTNAQARVDAARSSVQSARADRDTATANMESARAALNESQVASTNTGTLYGRSQDLSGKGLISKNDLDTARTNYETAQARQKQADAGVLQAQARVNSAGALIQQMQAQLAQAEADLSQARINLGYTSILSPIDGVVISRSVDVGQTVAASLQSPTLFTIANDLTKMQVNASIDEADIGNISSSADVRFTVDAFPGESFRGRIHEIRLSPSTVQNVVTYNAILDIENPELKLKPGMTANITISVDRRDRALKIPNTALRYTPPGATAQRVEPTKSNPVEDLPHKEEVVPIPQQQLAPGQKWDPANKVQLDRPKEDVLRRGRVWVLNAQLKPEPRSLLLGITDGAATEVVSGQLQAGDAVIIGDSTQTTAQPKEAVRNPLLPIPRGSGRRGM